MCLAAGDGLSHCINHDEYLEPRHSNVRATLADHVNVDPEIHVPDGFEKWMNENMDLAVQLRYKRQGKRDLRVDNMSRLSRRREP
jgi:hypothetical protein